MEAKVLGLILFLCGIAAGLFIAAAILTATRDTKAPASVDKDEEDELELWCVGHDTDRSQPGTESHADWIISGLYFTRETAVEKCRNERYFVFPMSVNAEFSDEVVDDTEWPVLDQLSPKARTLIEANWNPDEDDDEDVDTDADADDPKPVICWDEAAHWDDSSQRWMTISSSRTLNVHSQI